MSLRILKWGEGALYMLDQRTLPHRSEWLELHSSAEVAAAIRDMAVRGAPAIGVAAAYGFALAAHRGEDLDQAKSVLAASRPTAVNLFWALDRMASIEPPDPDRLLEEAKAIEREDVEMNLAIGRHGAEVIMNGWNVLTVCNTGALATAGHGTALGVIRTAHADGKAIQVLSCETRPRLQGLKLTAYELLQEGIPFHCIADGAAAWLMAQGEVDCVIAGADRIASNGDSANKIGTYALAVSARYHDIPFYIAAPTSTIDRTIATGKEIIIEERSPDELTSVDGYTIAPVGTPVRNPAFDVTPADLIDGIITEGGVHRPPYRFVQVQAIPLG